MSAGADADQDKDKDKPKPKPEEEKAKKDVNLQSILQKTLKIIEQNTNMSNDLNNMLL